MVSDKLERHLRSCAYPKRIVETCLANHFGRQAVLDGVGREDIGNAVVCGWAFLASS